MIDRIARCDCIEGMRALPDACIPMTLTSPPYDSIRDYGGHEWSPKVFRAVAEELYRVTTPGGVVVWVVQDQVLDGRESGTFSRQRLYFEEVGFGVYSTMIMVSNGFRLPQGRRYVNQYQYAVVLSKGRPRSVTLLRDRPNSTAGESSKGKVRSRDGVLSLRRYSDRVVAEYGRRSNVWIYDVGWAKSTGDDYAFEHPAVMSEKMAEDHILSWSKPGDFVFDPFLGSGTTCKMALLNDRHYLGFEVHRPFYQVAVRRMQDAHAEHRRRLDAWLVGA